MRVVTKRIDSASPETEVVRGLDVVRLGPPGRARAQDRRALVALAWWLRRHRRELDVLQVVMWPDAIVAAAAAGLVGKTCVLWAIRGEITAALARRTSPVARLRRGVRRRLLARAQHVTLTAQMAAEFGNVGFRPDNMVIPVPVDCRHFRPPTDEERRAARRAVGVRADAYAVVYVGHLQRRKAVDRLIDAVARLRHELPDIRLLVVGGSRGAEDDTEDALRAQVVDAGIADVVSFRGVVPDPRTELWAADVLALPSLREGMPNSLLEGLACGLPCIAPASAGGDELLNDEVGIVPLSNDPPELATAIRSLADRSTRQRFAAGARARAEQFDVDHVADAYERLYEEMARKANTR